MNQYPINVSPTKDSNILAQSFLWLRVRVRRLLQVYARDVDE